MSSKVRFFTTDFIYLICSLVAVVVIAFLYNTWFGLVVAIFSAAFAFLYIAFGILQKVKWQQFAFKTLSEESFSTYLDMMSIPTALATLAGNIKWSNPAFKNIAGYGAMRNINKMVPGINIPDKEKRS